MTSKALAQDKSKLLTRILTPCQNCRTCLIMSPKAPTLQGQFPLNQTSASSQIFTIATSNYQISQLDPARALCASSCCAGEKTRIEAMPSYHADVATPWRAKTRRGHGVHDMVRRCPKWGMAGMVIFQGKRWDSLG